MLKYAKFVELPAIDQRRAMRFYAAQFGFRVARDNLE